MARGLARLLPCTVNQLAEFFGVSQSTIYNWQSQYPEFLEAIKEGRTSSDVNVVERLFENATGYSYTTQKAIKVKEVFYSETGRKIREAERVQVVDVEEFVPPQTVAQIFWLKNRVPEHFREKLHPAQDDPDTADLDAVERRQAEMAKAVDRVLCFSLNGHGHGPNGHAEPRHLTNSHVRRRTNGPYGDSGKLIATCDARLLRRRGNRLTFALPCQRCPRSPMSPSIGVLITRHRGPWRRSASEHMDVTKMSDCRSCGA
jgi:hypothetical protein